MGEEGEKTCHGALGLADRFLKDSAFKQQQGEKLGLLWAAFDRITELAHLVEEFKLEPCEAELREIPKELQKEKIKVQEMAQPLLSSEDPLIAEKAFVVMRDIHKASH